MDPPEDFTTIESVFVRHRNALVLRGQFTPVYTDYYLHLMQHGIRHPVELDQMLKDALAMLVLHLVARPWAETIAWTANLRAPRVNLFVTGGSRAGSHHRPRVHRGHPRTGAQFFLCPNHLAQVPGTAHLHPGSGGQGSGRHGSHNFTPNPNNARPARSAWMMKTSCSSPPNRIVTCSG